MKRQQIRKCHILESSGALRAPSILLCAVIHFASARTIQRLSPSIDTFPLMHQCLDCVRSTCKKCQEMEIAFHIYNGPLSKSRAGPPDLLLATLLYVFISSRRGHIATASRVERTRIGWNSNSLSNGWLWYGAVSLPGKRTRFCQRQPEI